MATGNITCSQCGKEYVWQASLAGHAVRCTCGETLVMPVRAPEWESVYQLAPSEVGHAVPDSGQVASDGESGMPCPSCGEPIEFAGVVCTACGYNVRTGRVDRRLTAQEPGARNAAAYVLPTSAARRATDERSSDAGPSFAPLMSDAPAGDAPAPVSPPAPAAPGPSLTPAQLKRLPKFGKHQRVRHAGDEVEKQSIVRYLITLGVMILLVVSLFAAKAFWPEPAKSVHPEDVEIVALLDSGKAADAREWLAGDPNRMAGGWSGGQIRARVDDWYRLGARKVWSHGGTIARSLTIELPDEPDKREKLFEWAREHHRTYREPIKEDSGQRYLVIICPP